MEESFEGAPMNERRVYKLFHSCKDIEGVLDLTFFYGTIMNLMIVKQAIILSAQLTMNIIPQHFVYLTKECSPGIFAFTENTFWINSFHKTLL